MIWPFGRHHHEPSAEAQSALVRSKVSLALANDLESRSACVSEELRNTLDRNHFAQTLEETMLGATRT